MPQVATDDAETRRVKTARGLEQGVGCHPRCFGPDLGHDPRKYRCMTKAQFSRAEPLFGLRKLRQVPRHLGALHGLAGREAASVAKPRHKGGRAVVPVAVALREPACQAGGLCLDLVGVAPQPDDLLSKRCAAPVVDVPPQPRVHSGFERRQRIRTDLSRRNRHHTEL